MSRQPSGHPGDLRTRIERSLERCLEWSQNGRHRRVLAEVERMLTLATDDDLATARLLIWKAQALLSMGYAERALPAAALSWELESSPHACHLLSAALHAVGDVDSSCELLRVGWNLFPDAVHLPMQLAMMLADQGRLPEALDVLDEVTPAHQLPDDMQVFLVGLRANLLATVGRWAEAEDVLRDGLGRHPDSSLLHETRDSLSRERSRRRAESALLESWRPTLTSLAGADAEVDDAITRCGSVLELSQLTVTAARRLWRSYLARGHVRPQSPDAWGAAAVLAVLELDGERQSAAAAARFMSVSASTVRSVLARYREFLDQQDAEMARRAFAAASNPRLDDHHPARTRGLGARVIAFPD